MAAVTVPVPVAEPQALPILPDGAHDAATAIAAAGPTPVAADGVAPTATVDRHSAFLPALTGRGPCIALAKQGSRGPQPQAAVKRWCQTPPR
tara:strand:+ start:3803 stop:4078 length:276 start_codon:yes stop_codon:yes gene_type:complete